MDRTDILEILNQCNILNPEESNSEDFILSCINQPNKKNPIQDDYCINMSIQYDQNDVEGFSNDHSSHGPGVSYTPLGVCHDGQIRNQDGLCSYQQYRGRNRDGDWQRGNHNETMHLNKELYNICSSGTFLGLQNGHPICEKDEDNLDDTIEGFTLDSDKIKLYEKVN